MELHLSNKRKIIKAKLNLCRYLKNNWLSFDTHVKSSVC